MIVDILLRVVIVVSILAFAVGIYGTTRPKICAGTWNSHHTVLTVSHCHIEWSGDTP